MIVAVRPAVTVTCVAVTCVTVACVTVTGPVWPQHTEQADERAVHGTPPGGNGGHPAGRRAE